MSEAQTERKNVLLTGGILIAGAVLALPFQHASKVSEPSKNQTTGKAHSLLPLSSSPQASGIGLAIQPQVASPPVVVDNFGEGVIGKPGFNSVYVIAPSPNNVNFDAQRPATPQSTYSPASIPAVPVVSLPSVPDQYEPLLANRQSAQYENSIRQLEQRQTELASQRSRRAQESGRLPSSQLPLDAVSAAGDTETFQYVIRDGDTLAGIAEKFMGDARFANHLFQWNQSVLSDPNLLPIGQQITVARVARN